jgi:hypothetical protein
MKAMPVRDFMRGGYKLILEPTVVTKHGRPVFTVLPPFQSYMLVDTKIGKGETTKTSSR